jgi:hypothetical protein
VDVDQNLGKESEKVAGISEKLLFSGARLGAMGLGGAGGAGWC